MRVRADTTRCEGYANCVIAAPDVFSLDDDFIVEVLDERPDDGQRAAVEEAVDSCPTAALSIEGD